MGKASPSPNVRLVGENVEKRNFSAGGGDSYLEQFSKIRATGGENDAMGFQAFAVAGQRHVHKVLIVPQIFKRRGYAALVIVPSQTEMLCIYHRCVYSPAIRKRTPAATTVRRTEGVSLRI